MVKPGGRVVISDDSIVPEQRHTPMAQKLMSQNVAFGSAPPTEILPAEAKPYELSWWIGVFYILSFRKNER